MTFRIPAMTTIYSYTPSSLTQVLTHLNSDLWYPVRWVCCLWWDVMYCKLVCYWKLTNYHCPLTCMCDYWLLMWFHSDMCGYNSSGLKSVTLSKCLDAVRSLDAVLSPNTTRRQSSEFHYLWHGRCVLDDKIARAGWARFYSGATSNFFYGQDCVCAFLNYWPLPRLAPTSPLITLWPVTSSPHVNHQLVSLMLPSHFAATFLFTLSLFHHLYHFFSFSFFLHLFLCYFLSSVLIPLLCLCLCTSCFSCLPSLSLSSSSSPSPASSSPWALCISSWCLSPRGWVGYGVGAAGCYRGV